MGIGKYSVSAYVSLMLLLVFLLLLLLLISHVVDKNSLRFIYMYILFSSGLNIFSNLV